ncbi:CDP-6-deoxy-delta-3,4-glucoseen reductase [Orrella marina]|uniref:CDP-6-deoxy-delta-3,4-glucoseen reductase n=1 Tax=Orrella marina TaxID=2163011 RepID=A0A2R4XID9_9BURK|nr:CDP-6-deoxy-delta-3,4-glucoseen reductase [Orrella marina]AWB33523.1 CDP-6-deoxy-delta-3,4-glucoseen reductase [Orrella marina]
MATFQIKIEPSEHQFSATDDQSVLDAALAAGIVLPYSCRSGACSSCKGKVLSGEYDAGNAPEQVLSADELDAGFTLLCQAMPRSDMVIESREVRMASDIQIRKLPVRVVGIEMPSHDVAVLTLQLPAAETFRYYAGQYVDLLLKDGKRRSFSMATPPEGANQLELHVRHMPGGYFTDHVFGAGATKMKEREILRFEGPLGSFFLRQDNDKPIIFLASGTGFAPIKAIIEQMIAQSNPRPAILYWGGRRPRDLYMSDLASSWQEKLPGFRYIPVISDALPEDGWTGRTGFVHQAVLDDFPDLGSHEVYACGNPAMVEAARHSFDAAGLPEEAFFMDAFTPAADAAQG